MLPPLEAVHQQQHDLQAIPVSELCILARTLRLWSIAICCLCTTGGRLTTRKTTWKGLQFDHGCQFIRPVSETFKAVCEEWREAGQHLMHCQADSITSIISGQWWLLHIQCLLLLYAELSLLTIKARRMVDWQERLSLTHEGSFSRGYSRVKKSFDPAV
jgi:hypothetical protein